MRVALVHDWLTGMRGGERVLERLCRLFPDSEIFTLVWNRGSVSRAIESRPIHVSFLAKLPRVATHYRWYLPLFAAAIESLRPRGFDAVISTSHAVAKGVPAGGTFHLSYVFTPMRYVWDLEREYFPPGRFGPLDPAVRAICAGLRRWDARTGARPDLVLADSAHVAARIRRCWNRAAAVVYPPVELARFAPGADDPRGRGYDLVAGAFAPYKRADLALAACRALGRRLVVVGSGQEEARLRALGGPAVEFRGWVSDAEMARLYAGARCLIFPGEEDFGIVPVEAMASGTPVVAFGRGGAVETVGAGMSSEARGLVAAGGHARVPGGILFGTQSEAALAAALLMLDQTRFEPPALRRAAERFDAPAFDRAFLDAFERGRAAHAAARAA